MLNLLNMMDNWACDDSADEEKEEEEERKRKREPECSENDLLLVVKMVLDSIFGDTKLKWKSGEKTTEATKRARVVGQLLSGSRSCSNLMGRRNDLVLYNKKNVVLCLSELKDGSNKSRTAKRICGHSIGMAFTATPITAKATKASQWFCPAANSPYPPAKIALTILKIHLLRCMSSK
ncbi:hypothetical protein EDC96DRAFT_161814 [Choanephora cucurbitarum]|nr:hypothetical protein EDC96DRAFT_161814 [Choanephora cucurbitarum]